MFTLFISKEVTKTLFRVCIKDFAGYDGQRSDAAVDYLVIGGDISYNFFISMTSKCSIRDTSEKYFI